MKVEQKKEFVPVTIVLETEEELKDLFNLLAARSKFAQLKPNVQSLYEKLCKLP